MESYTQWKMLIKPRANHMQRTQNRLRHSMCVCVCLCLPRGSLLHAAKPCHGAMDQFGMRMIQFGAIFIYKQSTCPVNPSCFVDLLLGHAVEHMGFFSFFFFFGYASIGDKISVPHTIWARPYARPIPIPCTFLYTLYSTHTHAYLIRIYILYFIVVDSLWLAIACSCSILRSFISIRSMALCMVKFCDSIEFRIFPAAKRFMYHMYSIMYKYCVLCMPMNPHRNLHLIKKKSIWKIIDFFRVQTECGT